MKIIYFLYYLRNLDVPRFKLFLKYASGKTGKSKAGLIIDSVMSVFIHNISILEYFHFRFYDLPETEREKWAGMGYMYEFQLKMNPKTQRSILDDKRLFQKKYREFITHKAADIQCLEIDKCLLENLLANSSGKIVLKSPHGKCGTGIEVVKCGDFCGEKLIGYMKRKGYGIAEEYIIQHESMNRLSPTGVNTIRIITQLDQNGRPKILGCRLRISVNSCVDNLAAGNLAAAVDAKTGIVKGPGVYGDITKPDCDVHPATNAVIQGFRVPFWGETLELAERAAQKHTQNRSVGWDIAITGKGPTLVEGNHDWCKLLWQLPVKRGLKGLLDKY